MIDTYDIVILTKTAELSRRYGLKLSESSATLKFYEGHHHLVFLGAPTDDAGAEKFESMMASLGSSYEKQEVVTTDIDELNARLDKALNLAPKSRAI